MPNDQREKETRENKKIIKEKGMIGERPVGEKKIDRRQE